jgi:urease alpha subunit
MCSSIDAAHADRYCKRATTAAASAVITVIFDATSLHAFVTVYAAAVQVDPETYVVTVDGVALKCEAANTLPLSRLYFLF